MREDWRQITLREEIELKTGFPFKSARYSDDENDIRLLRGDNIVQGSLRWANAKRWSKTDIEKCQKFLLCEGDVILAMDRPWIDAGLKFAYIKSTDLPCLQVQRTARLTGGDNLLTDYLRYIIGSRTFTEYVKIINTGSSIPHISSNQIKDFSVVIPPIEIQKPIAKVLSDLDAKIELNNKINAELEAMAKLIYDYWFVQFDFPDKNGKPYKSSGRKMVWNEELKQEIPEGWEVKTLLETSSFISRGISPKYMEDGGSCVINQKCVRQGTVLFEQTRRNNEDLRDSSKKRVELYDVLVNSTGVGTLGRVSLVRRLPEKTVTVDSHVTLVRSNENQINKFYFGYSLLHKQLEIERLSLGSTGQVELSRYQLEGIKLIIPSADLQQKFEGTYYSICKELANNEIQIQNFTELRDWLLPMLMNGQVKVK